MVPKLISSTADRETWRNVPKNSWGWVEKNLEKIWEVKTDRTGSDEVVQMGRMNVYQ